MNLKPQSIALALSAIIIFTAGTFWGRRMGNDETMPNPASSHESRSETANANMAADRSNGARPNTFRKPSALNPEHQEIIRNLRNAMLLPLESRNTPLLEALEKTTKLSLSKDLIAELQKIVDEGEIESSHYVLSLMEQREEKESIELLLYAAKHQNRDVADRALFALEAVAGTVFKSNQEAAAWAANWHPDPEREKLFAPVGETTAESPADGSQRFAGPRSLEPNPHTLKRE